MTIEELLAATGLTANDLVPIYDAEAAQNVEPTQKITAAQFAAAVKVLASLVNTTEMNAAIQQSTAKFKTVTSASVTLNAGGHQNTTITHDTPTIIAAIVYTTPNAAYVFGNTQSVSATSITIGSYNTATSAVSGVFSVLIIYRENNPSVE